MVVREVEGQHLINVKGFGVLKGFRVVNYDSVSDGGGVRCRVVADLDLNPGYSREEMTAFWRELKIWLGLNLCNDERHTGLVRSAPKMSGMERGVGVEVCIVGKVDVPTATKIAFPSAPEQTYGGGFKALELN